MIDIANRIVSAGARRFLKRRSRSALVIVASLLSAACGDTSGPGSLDANSALQSLALGLQGSIILTPGSQTTPDISSVFGGIAPMLTQTSITIDGSSQPMYALGVRETLPDGTCEEDLYVDPEFPNDPGTCTPPFLNTALIFWQSHSANEPPDRMLFVIADVGTVNFDFSADPDADIPAFAFYTEGEEDFWASLSGTLTTNVTSLNQPCETELPPYAKSGTCSFAAFDEHGQMVFEPFTFDEPSSTPQHKTIAIPSQTVHGLWVNITEVQPVILELPALTRVGGRFLRLPNTTVGPGRRFLPTRLARLAPTFIRAR